MKMTDYLPICCAGNAAGCSFSSASRCPSVVFAVVARKTMTNSDCVEMLRLAHSLPMTDTKFKFKFSIEPTSYFNRQ